jgi:hypothetical protein
MGVRSNKFREGGGRGGTEVKQKITSEEDDDEEMESLRS